MAGADFAFVRGASLELAFVSNRVPCLFVREILSSSNQLFSSAFSRDTIRPLIFYAGLFSCLLGLVCSQWVIGGPLPELGSERTKIAEGEYAIHEHSNSGAVGPFEEEVYNFHESWTLWRDEKGQYLVEGVRRFESPKDEHQFNRFVVELTRDLTVNRMKEFAKLKWVRDSGPLSCEFLPTQLDCSSGGSDPKKEIKLRTPVEKPYGLLWPVSPFSFSGITREVERDPKRATQADLVRIEQPGMADPVRATILQGPILYLGEEDFEAAGRKWRAHKFSLKIPLQPQYLIWTSPKGLLLALAIEHEHKDWPEEGLRLSRFESSTKF
jgi:hypothetical protein